MVALKDRMFYDMLGCCAYHYTLEKTRKKLEKQKDVIMKLAYINARMFREGTKGGVH